MSFFLIESPIALKPAAAKLNTPCPILEVIFLAKASPCPDAL